LERRTFVTIGVLVVALAITASLVIFTLRRAPPPIPSDTDHLMSRVADDCLACHGPDGGRPRGRNHPLNNQCFNCHERG